jgi:hypothetical protein
MFSWEPRNERRRCFANCVTSSITTQLTATEIQKNARNEQGVPESNDALLFSNEEGGGRDGNAGFV